MNLRRQLRGALLTGALLFLAWEAFGAVRWVAEAEGVGSAASQFWTRLTGDWMLLLVATDHLLLAGIVVVLIWLDAARAGWGVPHRLALGVAFVALGSPVVLWYLAWRLKSSRVGQPPGRAPAGA